MLKQQLLKLAKYNLWANTCVMDWLIKCGEANADANCESSFPTLRKTVYHIYDAEHVWILRLNNVEIAYWPPSRDFNFSLTEFSEILKAQSQALINLITGTNENLLREVINYHNVKGELFSNSVSDVINHVVNHSTYHRGQLITMMRSLGFKEVGATDYIAIAGYKLLYKSPLLLPSLKFL
jgi:uncharacterized damage-inducible protein DinB